MIQYFFGNFFGTILLLLYFLKLIVKMNSLSPSKLLWEKSVRHMKVIF